jgi:hypothetical protein
MHQPLIHGLIREQARRASMPPPRSALDIDSAVICAIALHEEPYIQEFLDYHKKLGFCKVYIYDNSEKFILREWASDFLEVVHFPGPARQVAAYNHFLQHNKNKYTWAAFIDLDEFVVLYKHRNIIDFLRETCNSGAVSLNWYMFSGAGQLKPDGRSVMERFVMRQPEINEHVKTIARLEDVLQIPNCHYCTLKRGTQKDPSGLVISGPFNRHADGKIAAINHYYFKSLEEYTLKKRRGRSDIVGMESEDVSAWHQQGDQLIEDRRALGFMRGE